MTPARRLRACLTQPEPVVAVGAHDALSAKLAAAAGFGAIWASGFGISAVRAVPDANILTMTETLEAVKQMIAAVDIPVIADCDSGYGNAINVMRTVREFEREGAAGLCLEDNVFPKRCSFYAGVRRDLVTAEEHADKIRAAASARTDPDFLIIARTEALIAGYGLDEALARARAYAEAGADAVLVHSKAPTFAELHAFAARWRGPVPLVAVPTTYPDVTLDELAADGFRMVIFANQLLRGAIGAMRRILATWRQARTAGAVEREIVPLADVYDLVGLSELQAQERAYLAPTAAPTAVIIAAGSSPELLPLTHDRPKAMLEVQGQTILERQLHALRSCGVHDIVVVRGHQKHAIDLPGVRYYDNERFCETGELHSLLCARAALDGPFVFLYADILFDPSLLQRLLAAATDIALLVDRAVCDQPPAETAARRPDLVRTEGPAVLGHRFVPSPTPARVLRIGAQLPLADANGEFVGLALFSARGAAVLRECSDALGAHAGPFGEAPSFAMAKVTDILQHLIDRGHDVRAVDVYKGWTEVDTFDDYRRAWGLDEPGSSGSSRPGRS
jgi:phosphoenolpyruvate phosphomutase